MILLGLELRALETEKDYQKEFDRLINLEKKEHLLADKCLDEWNAIGKKLQKERQDHLNQASRYHIEAFKIYQQAKKKGFELKERCLKADLEKRKRAILKRLEERALKTQKDYQREIDICKDWIKDYLEEIEGLKGSIKHAETQIKLVTKEMNDYYKEGTAKGFKLKK